MKDYLILLKNEYLSSGATEEEAIKLAIRDFGDSNFIGNNIKINLPSYNKYSKLILKENIICLTEMFFVYFLFICISTLLNINLKSVFFYIVLAFSVTVISFVFINKKLNDEKNKMRESR